MIIHTVMPHEYILPSRYKARRMYTLTVSGIPKIIEENKGSAENLVFSTDPEDYIRFMNSDISSLSVHLM